MQGNLHVVPQVVPVNRVSSAWRVTAILALLGMAFLLLLVFILGLALVIQISEKAEEAARLDDEDKGTPAVVSQPATQAKVSPLDDDDDDPDEPEVDPGTQPYPVKADLKRPDEAQAERGTAGGV